MDTATARTEVAATIRALMGRGIDGRRVTQTQLGAILGLSQGPVSERLAGKTAFDLDELLAIAEFFNVSIASIIVEVDERRRPTGQGNRLSIWNDGTDRVVSDDDMASIVSLHRSYDQPLELDEVTLAA